MPINLLSPFSKKQAGTAEESLLGTKVDIKTYDDKPLGVVVRHSIEELYSTEDFIPYRKASGENYRPGFDPDPQTMLPVYFACCL
eukprot:jgi/Bigna1/133195/aug1.20_g7903